jgi:hypothetical protein
MRLRTTLLSLTLLTLPLTAGAWAAGGAGAESGSVGSNGLQLAMTLYAGGLSLGHVDMDAKFAGDKYHVTSNLETSGVVNVFWQSQIQATSSGKLDKKVMQVQSYDSFYTGHKANHQEVALTYENGEPVRLYANPTYPTTGYEVKPEEKKGTFDPLSAVIHIMAGIDSEAGNPCGVKTAVYDGRRRYNVNMTKVKPVDIKMDNGLYKGPAMLCQIEYKQISGYKPRVLHDTNFPVINAWVGVFPSKEAGRSFAVPLRVWADTQYGVVAAVATTLKIDGKPVQ